MKRSLEIPSEEDWGDYKNDLDQKYAYKMFFGKNLAEARLLFQGAVIERTEELRFMPVIPFQYYIGAYYQYLTSLAVLNNRNASDTASCFLRLVESKLSDDPDSISPLMKELMSAIEYLAKNQTLFGADVDIYGDFNEILSEIKRLAQM
ncbi:hypothetical protein UNDKW_4086 [Undibacterium sp. KW1]|uniref:hypothetical protein n=1 Tax=Undibacterium sp. KW1 TaxID=2058624 RepID=UPI001331D462|nr:hypothetical protein [Undibacterium sp. KW1]BBB62359.1 hypothetical protein UNDKW_4086 [Undibacterium sp. KW1]